MERTYRVTILSSFTHKTWTGDYRSTATDDALLGELFRYFNRVDPADVERLTAIGYDLPSLSAGDVIGIDYGPDERPRMWIVERVGWREVWPGMGLAPEVVA